MKAYDIVAYSYGSDMFCDRCWYQAQKKIEPCKELVEPIFADEEFNWTPNCEECGSSIEVNLIEE